MAPEPTEDGQQLLQRDEGDGGAPSSGGGGAELDLSEARALLADRLRGRPTRANFRTGDLTICTLVPMRSVPHRVVCLLGLDDGLFPRQADQDGDDLLLADQQIGDRDVPSEDRQLLLDALMAAEEHLIITFEGRDQHLNQRRPPAVPVAELLDVVDKTVRVAARGTQPASWLSSSTLCKPSTRPTSRPESSASVRHGVSTRFISKVPMPSPGGGGPLTSSSLSGCRPRGVRKSS